MTHILPLTQANLFARLKRLGNTPNEIPARAAILREYERLYRRLLW